MSEQTIYDPNEFKPKKSLEARYATKIVNNKFYGVVKVGDIVTQEEGRGDRVKTFSDEQEIAFILRCIEHYKDRNPHMLSKYLRSLIIELEKKIRRKHCE